MYIKIIVTDVCMYVSSQNRINVAVVPFSLELLPSVIEPFTKLGHSDVDVLYFDTIN